MTVLRWKRVAMSAMTCVCLAVVVTCAIGPNAAAEAPTKVAWWNNASAFGTAAPAPDTPAGGVRVSVASEQTLSFGAIELMLPRDESGTLTLSIAHMTGSSAQMLNRIVACPTVDDNWKSGDNQDGSTAPEYDCRVHTYPGHLSDDGSSMTFLVDGSADVRDSILSLAIVPQHTGRLPVLGSDTGGDSTPPFAVDFDKPTGDTFIVTGSQASPSQPSEPAPSPTGPATSGPPANGATGSSPAGVGSLPPGGSGATPTASVDQPPVVAGQPASSTSAPQALRRDAGLGGNKRNVLLLLFVLLSAGAAMTRRQDVRHPRSLLQTRVGEFEA